jgi:hypothetical protein
MAADFYPKGFLRALPFSLIATTRSILPEVVPADLG